MSTDNEMDDLLTGAGQRWRAANPGPAAAPDFDVTQPAVRWRARWVKPVAAAAAVVLVAGGTAWFTTQSHHSHSEASGTGSGKGSGTAEQVTFGGLTGTQWTLFEVTTESGNSSNSRGADGSNGSLHIHSDGSFTGSDGCNAISGTAHITATTMTFDHVATTAMACTDANVTKVASGVEEILQGRVTWSVNDAGDGDDLVVDHAGVGELIYFGTLPVAPVTDPAKMPGTWQLTEYDQSSGGSGSGGSASGAGTSDGFGDLLVIDPDGTFKVQDRCYANVGHVAIGDGTATWSNVHLAGAIPCPATPDQKDEQARNALVDSLLSGDTSWEVETSGDLKITGRGITIVYAPYVGGATPSGSPTS